METPGVLRQHFEYHCYLNIGCWQLPFNVLPRSVLPFISPFQTFIAEDSGFHGDVHIYQNQQNGRQEIVIQVSYVAFEIHHHCTMLKRSGTCIAMVCSFADFARTPPHPLFLPKEIIQVFSMLNQFLGFNQHRNIHSSRLTLFKNQVLTAFLKCIMTYFQVRRACL